MALARALNGPIYDCRTEVSPAQRRHRPMLVPVVLHLTPCNFTFCCAPCGHTWRLARPSLSTSRTLRHHSKPLRHPQSPSELKGLPWRQWDDTFCASSRTLLHLMAVVTTFEPLIVGGQNRLFQLWATKSSGSSIIHELDHDNELVRRLAKNN